MKHLGHQADDEHHQPAAPPGWVDQPAKMVENVYNLASSDQYFPSEDVDIFDWCLQLVT